MKAVNGTGVRMKLLAIPPGLPDHNAVENLFHIEKSNLEDQATAAAI